MTTAKSALRYLSGKNRVLDLLIQFEPMMADCFLTEYLHHKFSLTKLKRAFSRWQYALDGKAWNALYLENHDHPRIISRYGSTRYWRESGTTLAACYLFQQGTPFVYQGQELGMTNIRLKRIEQYLDVAAKNIYHSFHRREPEEKRMRRIHVSSRDSARTPVQWSGDRYAGFSTVKPWFYVNSNYKKVNAATEERDPNSILNFYRRCLALRKSSETLLLGNYQEYAPRNRKLYLYARSWKGERILVICSFSKMPVRCVLPKGFDPEEAELLLCNYPETVPPGILRPYETRVFRWNRRTTPAAIAEGTHPG